MKIRSVDLKRFCLGLGSILAALDGSMVRSNAQVPAAFPSLVITSNGPVAPGDFIGTFGVKLAVTNAFNVVLDNSGSNAIYYTNSTALWRTVTPSGLIAENNTSWLLRDETYGVVATYPSGDGHDFKLLPNGDSILLEHESIPTNLSQVVSGGRPDAVLDSLVFEELDANQQIVFRWRAIDHLAIADSLGYLNVASVDWTHCNSITIDPWDNNYLVSLRCFCQIIKVSRTTGDVIWRLGGVSNNFTFIGENPTNAPYYFIGEHNVHGMANTNIMLFDNGSLASQGSLAGRTYSRAVQYQLDETNMTATLVWQYIHNPVVLTPTEGIVKRFTNGNTYVGWVSAAQQGTGPVLTEVNASNQVMFELSAPGFKDQTILNKLVWNSPALIHSDTNYNIAAGNTYTGANSGVAVTVNSLSGSANNTLIVSEHDDADRFPQFSGKAPQVLVPRVTLASSNITALSVNLSFSLPQNSFSFDTPLYSNPTNLTIFQRQTVGQGVFVPLVTTYDPVAQKLNVTNVIINASTNEFIFTYPDLPEIPLPPILYGQGTQTSVDQAEPVVLQWTPRGFAHAYHLQVATNATFTNPVVDQAGLTNLTYTLQPLQTATTYYWRVNVTNYGGLSDWSTNSFNTALPTIQVTSPNGGEAWALGQTNFIQWNDNVSENVAIDLYKGGTLITHLTSSAANIGAYGWTISATNVPGTNYSIRVSSSTNAAVYGASAASFSIVVDPPSFTAQPTNQSVIAGNTALFSASVTGATPLAYQWLQNGTNPVNVGNISGATTNVLSLVSVTAGNAGNYTLVATNSYGAATSSVATLTVLLPPTITVPPAAQTIQCGSNASFSVTATSTAPLKYQWSLDGTALTAQTNATLTLTNVHLPNHTVAVVVTNLYGSATNSALLTVQDTLPPVITLLGANPMTNELGSTFTDPGATANDLCAGAVAVTPSGSVNTAVVGTNTLTYKADDGNGNTNTATRTVIVRDTTPPTILWSFTNLVLAANSNCVAAMPNVTGTNYLQATDLSLPLTITQTPTNNASLPLGTNVVVITVADAWDNKAYSTNCITVVPTTNSTPFIAGVTAAGGGVTLQLTGGYGSTYVLESTTNVPSGAWEPVVTNTVGVTCQWQFTDTQVTNYSQRFFRLQLVQ
jgi:hypothetical protein